MGFEREDDRGKVPISSHFIKGIVCQHDIVVDTDFDHLSNDNDMSFKIGIH